MFFESQNQTERRIAPRINFREPISFRFSETEEAGGCLSHDLSESGIKVHFNHFVRPRTLMAVRFRLKNMSQMMDLEGRVAWAHRVPCSDRYQLGIEFNSADDTSQDRIRQFVRSHRPK